MRADSRSQKKCPRVLGYQSFVQSFSHSESTSVIFHTNASVAAWDSLLFWSHWRSLPRPVSEPVSVWNTCSGCYGVESGFMSLSQRGCGWWGERMEEPVPRRWGVGPGRWTPQGDPPLSLVTPGVNLGYLRAARPRKFSSGSVWNLLIAIKRYGLEPAA